MRVVREEGVLALWRGCSPTVTRAMIVTASQMAVYDKSKAVILDVYKMNDGLAVQTGKENFDSPPMLSSCPGSSVFLFVFYSFRRPRQKQKRKTHKFN